ncbi:uncharacterized protein LOC128891708 [Hylaeus anthracinus]|uniref:uncharacterized protein LOC128891708 n=1 Tax=Hylaeus anthracinus TaxID=313031 RepID=UPI0023B97851|nr:uncharacterized protein LOC128891708 [Hylaeus anthracinus]
MCSNAKSRMDWSNETTLLFIELYKKNTCLWNPMDKNYKLRCVKNNAWKDICSVVKCSPHEARRKLESLLASFRRERNKELRTGTYRSSWFAFRSMQFLMNKFQPSYTGKSPLEKNTPTSEDSHTDEEDSTVECSHIPDERSNVEVKCDEKATSSAASNKIEKRKEFASPRKLLLKRKKFIQDPQMERAYRIIEETVSKRTARDASTIFGEHVTMKHRSYNRHTQSVVEHLISNILFDADMGKYNENSQSRDDYTALPVTPALSPSSSSTAPRTLV